MKTAVEIAQHLQEIRSCCVRVTDFDGVAEIKTLATLVRRLRSVRRGRYGAFRLSHKGRGCVLEIYFNEDRAYVHYFPYRDYLNHAGYRPTGMTPARCRKDVHFRLLPGSDAETLDFPPESIVTADVAISAACDFLKAPRRPASITWEML